MVLNTIKRKIDCFITNSLKLLAAEPPQPDPDEQEALQCDDHNQGGRVVVRAQQEAGSNAISTERITRGVDSPLWRWGAGET